MYKNQMKLVRTVGIWGIIHVFALMNAVICMGVVTSGKDLGGFAMLILFLLFGSAGIFLIVVFWKKYLNCSFVIRLNRLFEADADGFVPAADLARELGLGEPELIKKIEDNINKGYVVNVNYSAKDRAYLLSDKVGKQVPDMQGLPELKPFLGISCPGCAAALKIRAGSAGTCPFCGRLITAPQYPANGQNAR